jgi:hypothetical protein
MASREVCLILYHDPAIGIDEAEKALAGVLRKRSGDVLHISFHSDSPILRVRAINAVARDGRVVWDRDLPEPVARFPRAFEISFDDLDEVLDDINTLIDAQCTLEDLTGGACYNTWNDNLSMPGDR